MIKNREDANKYYGLINDLVDDYIDKWKIRPSSLKRYLSPGSQRFNKFLERNKLREIIGADTILKDIIEDRESMELDGILKFESFKMFESEEYKIASLKECLYKGIEKATSKMEKIIADHFDVNLGEIDIIDSGKHLFKLNDWNNDDHQVIVYTKDEIEVIKFSMIDHLYNEISKKKIELTEKISIELSDLIKKDQFKERLNTLFTKEFTINMISEAIGKNWKLKDEIGDHFIWIEE